jgi:hypothetical protein
MNLLALGACDKNRASRLKASHYSPNADSKVLYLADPITIGGVANINSLTVFDAVYTTVRGTPFAARAPIVSKGTP